ncbi:cilia- and flagella-associated protein 141 isoform X2 [Pseudophryne corroboree]|uniref:cilia- and flagella-associated protein 141 isoform X2 n=1 Tax=Pseudophryne corroboree TaxID=495146 RepID=UPI003081299C
MRVFVDSIQGNESWKQEHVCLAAGEQALNIHNAWKEDARGTIASRIQRRQSALVRQELKMANKELVLVRRAALQRLLQDEHRQYQEELIRLGKTFFGQRL